MNRNVQCPDCQTKMEEGFIPDDIGGNYTQTCWYPGEPAHRNWLLGVKVAKETKKPVECFRCPQCGLLKLYAE